jgi:hypothetical protein
LSEGSWAEAEAVGLRVGSVAVEWEAESEAVESEAAKLWYEPCSCFSLRLPCSFAQSSVR